MVLNKLKGTVEIVPSEVLTFINQAFWRKTLINIWKHLIKI